MTATTIGHERRSMPLGECRTVEDGDHRFIDLRILRYGVVDDYGSVWQPGCFDDSLDRRMPVMCWSHDWSDPIGRGVAAAGSPDGPGVRFRLDDFDAVPRSRQAFAQVQSGTITDCSVGFSNTQRRPPTDAEVREFPGCREIIESADLDEVSLVVRGAVPGAVVLGSRASGAARAVLADRVGRRILGYLEGRADLADTLASLRDEALAQQSVAAAEDGEVAQMVAGIDAVLDEAIGLIDADDPASLSANVAQARALLSAADTTIDALMGMLGIPDPDEQTQDGSSTVGVMSAEAEATARAAEEAADRALVVAFR